MSERKATSAPPADAQETKLNPQAADESLDKVRDILFGAQAREFERRFALLEEDLLRKTAEAREEARQKLEILEAQLRQQVQHLTDNLKTEQQERAKTINGLAMDLHELTQQLDEKINLLEAQSTQEQSDIRQNLLDEAKSLSEEIQHRSEELSTTMKREVKTLEQNKLNRSDIAALLKGMAEQILGK